MPKNDVLYCKGMSMDLSESDNAENHDKKWDDTQLNTAYDRALKLANVEVAKRLAMATNSQHEEKGCSSSQHTSKKQGKRKQWSAGMPCRAIYQEDGQEYEAFVLKVINNHECIVKFLGYDNSEQVDMNSMKPSHGKEAQQRQIEQAVIERGDESDDASASTGTDDIHSDRRQSSANTERSYYKKDSRKKNRNPQANNFHLPEVPMPDMKKLRNMASMDIPFPMPPPLQLPSHSDSSEDNAVSSMLLAWYMSGYYTGLYQGLKRSKGNKRESH